jgi:cobalt/nickel transport system permease protein
MHIPDGFVTGEAAVAGAVVAVAGLAVCLRKVRGEERERDLPIAGLAAAFFLVGDAPMFPITVGTEGHLLGGALAVCLLGPWLGAITIAVVTVFQALAFGDGGVSTLGLTIVMLALVPAFLGYPIAVALRRAFGRRSAKGLAIGCGIAAGIAVELSAVAFVAIFELGAKVDIDVSKIAISTLGAYTVIAFIEGTITGLIVRALLSVRPDLVRIAAPVRAGWAAAPAPTPTPAAAPAPARPEAVR